MLPASNTHWLNIQYRTLFRLDSAGRIVGENEPDRSAGPRFWLAGCAEGNICGCRADLPAPLAARLAALAGREPPLLPPAVPERLNDYLALLAECGGGGYESVLTYRMPHALAYPHHARLISSESEEGQALTQRWATEGMPSGLYALGFHGVEDLWAPWCAALSGDDVASLAFCARLADVGVELGLVTAEAFRGQGFAAAATAGWSQLASLRARALFYSTSSGNLSSQRVAARLGLSVSGGAVRIS